MAGYHFLKPVMHFNAVNLLTGMTIYGECFIVYIFNVCKFIVNALLWSNMTKIKYMNGMMAKALYCKYRQHTDSIFHSIHLSEGDK